MKRIKNPLVLILLVILFVACNEEIDQELNEPTLEEASDQAWEYELSRELTIYSDDNQNWAKILIQTDEKIIFEMEGDPDNWQILLTPEKDDSSTTSSKRTFEVDPEVIANLKPELYVSVIDHNFGDESAGFGLKHSDKYNEELEFAKTNQTLRTNYVHPVWRMHMFEAPVWFERVRVRRYTNSNVSDELNSKPVGSVFQFRNCGLCGWNNGTTLNWIYQSGIHDEYVRRNIRRIRVAVYHYGPTPHVTQEPNIANLNISNTNFSIYWTRY